MSGAPGSPGAAASQLAQLQAAAAALRTAVAAGGDHCAAAAATECAADSSADWESRLAEVNAAVGSTSRTVAANNPAAGHEAGQGGSAGAAASGGGSLASYQSELIEAVSSCPGNCVTFLPLGLGLRTVMDSVLQRAVEQHPGKHVLLVVDRPAHALTHAQRLRTELGLPTAVFCGGDFLYSFPQQFQSSRVLVFTAGLLLRLLKTGVYSLAHASFMLLLDAFTVVRNHPSNTLVREYWRNAEEGARPRVVGVLASQLPSKPRPFDRLRQNLRKLCHGLQARLLLPTGCGLAQMEAQLHHDSIQLHSYALGTPEERLVSLLQQHLLGLWDVLHEFGLNHFGRLVQFAAAGNGGGAGGGSAAGTPSTPAAGATPASAERGGGAPAPSPPQQAGQGQGRGPSTPLTARPPSAAGSPATIEGSPATPLQGLLPPGGQAAQQHGTSSAAAAAAEQPDPMQHDWAQVELQIVHSLWHSNALPSRGDHAREPDALALMMHVLDCVRALRALLELGPAACLARLPAALESLASLMQEGVGGPLPFATSVPPLRARIIQVATASPLLPWALQQKAQLKQQQAAQPAKGQAEQTAGPAPVQQQEVGEAATGQVLPEQQQEGRAADGTPDAPAALAPESQAAQGPAKQQRAEAPPQAAQQPSGSPLAKPTPTPTRQAAVAVADGPAAAIEGGSARAAALLELLQELQMGCHLSGQRRQVAVVAGSSESAAILHQLLASAKELNMVEVCPLAGAQPPTPSASLSGGPAGLGRSASLPSAGSLGRSASLGRAASLDAASRGGGDGNPETQVGGAGGTLGAAGEEPVGSDAAPDAVPDSATPTSGSEAAGGGATSSEAAAAAAAKDGSASAAASQDAPAGELVRSASDTEAAVAAAWAQAAPAVRVGKLVVHLLTTAELPALEQRVAGYHSLVWYSSGDVLHAASQELESAALAACHRLSAASAAVDAEAGGRRKGQRLECHVLATASQVLALGEVRRVDHSLKAAMELVQLGDAAAEEKLTMLVHRDTAPVLEPEARAVLEMLCCGLCGAAPAFATMATSPSRKASSSRRAAAAAAVAAAAAATADDGAGTAGPEQGSRADAAEPPPAAADELAAAAGSHAEEGAVAAADGEAVANGAQAAASAAGALGEPEEDEDAATPLLFRSSVTLPAAYFPPERFHAGGVSMPLDVFVGPPLPSEEQAANAAALLALTALHRLGIIVRYWPSRLLLAQHLLPRSLAAAAPPGALPGVTPLPTKGVSPAAAVGMPDEAAAGVAGSVGMLASAAHPGQQPGFANVSGAQQGQQPNVMNFFCPLCNVAATGHKAFDAHLRGFRHQRRIKQAQLLQQGQEVSAMLQGLLLDESVPDSPVPNPTGADAAAGVAAPRVAVRRPNLDELQEEEEGGEYGSPSFADRQVYSPEPTPFRCDTCHVFCTSQRLLEAHMRGRKHQRRVAGLDSPAGRPSSPKAQPLVTPYYCAMCGLYATSEEQLRMHMLGKRHTRMTHLHRQRMAGAAAAAVAALGEGGAASLQQQQHQLLMAAAAAATLSSGAAAWVPSSSSGLASGADLLDSASPLASPALGATGALGPASLAGLPPGDAAGSAGGMDDSMVALQGLLLDASGNQRIYRCDLCGVVTPSRRHYDYHLQGIKHTRRAMRAQGLDPGSASQPGTPASCGSPLAGSRSTSPSRGPRGRHSRHGSADWGGGAGGGPSVEPAPESLICSVCGIMATSAVNLEDHYKGRRHQKNVERQQAQAASTAAAAGSAAEGAGSSAGTSANMPPLPPHVQSPFAGAAGKPGAPGPPQRSSSLQRASSLQRQASGITLGADGLRLPSGALLSAGSLLNAGSLQRAASEVYDDFPCVRIGSILLPSSMDLRTFLEEMQQLDGTEDSEADLLPPIAEHHEPLGSDLAAAVGIHPPPPSSSAGGAGLAASAQLFTPSHTWAYNGGGSGTAERGRGTGGSSAGGASPSPGVGASRGAASAGGTTPRSAYQYGGSRTAPTSPSLYALSGGGYGGRGGRPGSAGQGARLSRFAQDQMAQQAQQQHAAAMGYGSQYGQPGQYGQPYSPQYGMQGMGMPAGYAIPVMGQQQYAAQHIMAQQTGYGGGYGGGYSSGTGYDASMSATLAAQQAAAMHQMSYGTAHHPAAYGGMPGGQGTGGFYTQQPPPPRGYR